MSAICLMSRDSRATCGASTSQGTPWSCLHQEPLADVLAWDSYSYGGPLPSDQAATMDAVAGELMLFGSLPSYGRPLSTRLGVGEAELPVDPATVGRFLAKCAPVDDQGHRWWLGAIDGGADRSGGYGRFQAGCGDTVVTTTAHRYAWTLEHGAIPPGLVVRHRCDEPLCTATQDLDLGTYADNRWDAIARPHRAASLDVRGSADRSRAIREAVLRVLALGATNPGAIGDAARAAMLAGDPNRDQLTLWPMRNYSEVL